MKKNYINYEHEHNPMIEMEIGGYCYSFTVDSVPKENHQWLLDVVSSQMQEVHDRAVQSTKADLQNGIKSLLDIK